MQARKTVFEGHGPLKLGTHCRSDVSLFEQYVLREYTVYRLYNQEEQFRSVIFKDTGHEYLPEMKAEMAAWFERYLPVSK